MPSQEGSPYPCNGERSSSERASALKDDKENPPPTVSTSTTPPHVTSNKTNLQKSNSRTRIVGHARAHHTRVPSHGKNLNRLSKLTHTPAAVGATSGIIKHHRRTNSDTLSTSPGTNQQTKRVGSSTSLARTGSNVSLKKNVSKSNLVKPSQNKRVESTGALNGKNKPVEAEATIHTKERSQHQQRHPSVHFDLKDSEDEDSSNPDADWTEVSNSDSPSKTRTNSANNSNNSSEVASPEQVRVGQAQQVHQAPPSPPPSPSPRSKDQGIASQAEGQEPGEITTIPRSKLTTPKKTANHQHQAQSRSSPLLTNTITSRLLRRHPTNKAVPPKMSVISATSTLVESDGSRSTLVDNTPSPPSASPVVAAGSTPGDRENVVSRFLSASGGSHHGTPTEDEEAGSISPIRPQFNNRRRHGEEDDEENPPSPTPSHQPLPSRMQQKLWLQRASSTIEPRPHTPPNSHPHNPHHHDHQLNGIHPIHAGGGVGNDAITALIQKESERAAREYRVVRRNFDPVRESIVRLRGRGGGGGSVGSGGGGSVRAGNMSLRSVGGAEENDHHDDGGDDGDDYAGHGRDPHAGQSQGRDRDRDRHGNNNNNTNNEDRDADDEEDRLEGIKKRMWGL